MTEVTEEARAELDAILDAMGGLYHELHLPVMLALDRHHNRTPPDPYVAKARELLRGWRLLPPDEFDAFVAALKRIFPDG